MSLTFLGQHAMVNAPKGVNCKAPLLALGGFAMAGAARDRLSYTGPTLEDCEKCWHTIISELVTDASVRIEFVGARNPQHITRLVVWSPGLDPETGGPRDHIWATKELQAGFEAITYRQLYDCLIVAYRRMEAHLGGQIPMQLP